MLAALIKLGCWSVLALGIAGFVVVKAVRAMRAGEPYRFSFLDGGLLFAGQETRPKIMIGAAVAYVVLIGGITAWPLGLFDWFGELGSGCVELVTPEEVQRIGDPSYDELYVHELDTICAMSMHTPEYRMVDVEISYVYSPDLSRWAGMQGDTRMIDTANGGRIARIDEVGRTKLLVMHGQAGATVSLPVEDFDEADVVEVAALMHERREVLTPYAEAGAPAGALERFLRGNAPYLFLGLVFLLLAAGVGFTIVRRNRAIKRALEDDAP